MPWSPQEMTTRFNAYSRTPRGQRLAAIVDDPDRYPEYRAFSREGFPAVTALVSLVEPELGALRHSDRREFDAAKQFVGWAVGVIMCAHRPRSSADRGSPAACLPSGRSGAASRWSSPR